MHHPRRARRVAHLPSCGPAAAFPTGRLSRKAALMSTPHNRDLYAVLGLAPDASQDQISRAYHARLRQHHPDTREQQAPEPGSDGVLQDILAAYAVLRDPARRAAYDQRHTITPGPPRPASPTKVTPLAADSAAGRRSRPALSGGNRDSSMTRHCESRAECPRRVWPMTTGLDVITLADSATITGGRDTNITATTLAIVPHQ